MAQIDLWADRERDGGLVYLHFAVTPSDTEDLPVLPRGIYCISSGTVNIRDEAGTDITYPVVEGQILSIRAVRILATGTTATIVGWP